MITIDLSKQVAFDADPKVNQFCYKSRLGLRHSNVFHSWKSKSLTVEI